MTDLVGEQSFGDREVVSSTSTQLGPLLQRLLAEQERTGSLSVDRVLAVCERRSISDELRERAIAVLSQMKVLERQTARVDGFGGGRIAKRVSAKEDLLGRYLHEAAQFPLLSAEDERVLGRRIEAGLLARQRLSDAAERGIDLPFSDRRTLQRTVREGDRATEQMIRSNLRLVVSIARKHQHMGLPMLDLIQEGNLGLIHAVSKFDHSLGYKFSTYSTWWIRQAITRAIADKGRIIRLPVHFHERIRHILKCRMLLGVELGREPTLPELAEQANLDPAVVQFALDWNANLASLDAPLGEDGATVGDLVADPGPDPADLATAAAERQHVRAALATLTEREQLVIRLRFGLEDHEARTLEEVGQKLGVTRERIRQIESKVLQRLSCDKTLRSLIVRGRPGTTVQEEEGATDADN